MSKNNGRKLKVIFWIFLLLMLFSSYGKGADKLAEEFTSLPESVAGPWCYYYWINDDISKEGVTKDLLAMKEAGIGAAFIGNINLAGIDGKVPLFSEGWWEVMVHAVTEGKRIGVDIGVFNSPGWSQSGGPWNTDEEAMRYITWTEAKVSGPGKVSVNLANGDQYFKDIRVLAFSSLESEKRADVAMAPKLRSTPALPSLSELSDGDHAGGTMFDAGENEYRIELEFSEKIKANSLYLYPAAPILADCILSADIDGVDSVVREFRFDRSNFSAKVGPIVMGPLAISLPGVESARFTLVLKNIKNFGPEAGLAEIVISEQAVLEEYIEKQLGKMHPTPYPVWDSYSWKEQSFAVGEQLIVEKEKIKDISELLQPDGTLTWDAPDGDWTLVRFGTTVTGAMNHPAAPQGTGFEVDKMSGDAVRGHFEKFMGELLKRVPEESKSALKYVIVDSYEVGSQNWTDGYAEKFKEKYGYDPIGYLPVLTGRIVGSVTESERFLWDLRRAVANDVAYEYVGGLKKISNEYDMTLWLENYGHWGYPSEFLLYGGQSDLVGGEFWDEGALGNIECKAASSAGHIYGKPVIYGEAFTSSQKSFLRHPAMMKARGDWSFVEGINHFVLHVYIHQPDDERKPGVNAWFGTEFNRHNTWFDYMTYWTDYVERCQLLLRQGHYAADVCYFIGEDAPIMTGARVPELPRSYSYDYINADVILNRLAVKDGRFVLADGMSYRLMVLPPLETMRPEVLTKIEEMVKRGGNILGERPERSPSLEGYPGCDREVEKIASRMWDGERKNGEGMVFEGVDIQRALDRLEVEKDVELEEGLPILWTHRTMSGREIYFLSNQSGKAQEFEASFRGNGLKPQLWDAVCGEIRMLNEFTSADGRVAVPVKLEPLQSCFIVFTNEANERAGAGYKENFHEGETLMSLDGRWTVDFLNKEIGPEGAVEMDSLKGWNFYDEERIRYYSGEATYRTTFVVDKLPASGDVYLNLGEVGVMARARLNGEELGGVWIAPFLLNTSGNLKQGENTLEVDVVNLWRNRMVLDKTLSAEERYTWTMVDDVDAGEELRVSGLIGPVTLELKE